MYYSLWYVMTLMVISAKPDMSHKPISDSLDKLSRKGKRECSGSSCKELGVVITMEKSDLAF